MFELPHKFIKLNKNNKLLYFMKLIFLMFISEGRGKLNNAVQDTERTLQMNVFLYAVQAVHQINSVQLLISALARVDI